MANSIKHQLYAHCESYIAQRIHTIESAMSDAQASANSETKSTAGDKHDTARAMMQLAAEQNSKHLAEATKLKQVMHLIDPTKTYQKVQLGSLVIAENGAFFIAISAGKIQIEDKLYFAVSPTSPIGLSMQNLKAEDSFSLNGKEFKILSIH